MNFTWAVLLLLIVPLHTSVIPKEAGGVIAESYLQDQRRGNFNRIGWGDSLSHIIYRNGNPTEQYTQGNDTIMVYKELGKSYYISSDGGEAIVYMPGIDITFYYNTETYSEIVQGVYKIAVKNIEKISMEEMIREYGIPLRRVKKQEEETFYYAVKENEHYLVYFKGNSFGMLEESGITIDKAE